MEPAWASLKDEELLSFRICDLQLEIKGTDLEPRIAQLYTELTARGIALNPPCYLGDEWFTPRAVPAIAIPFYLSHPRLKALELKQMMEVEGTTNEQCAKLLRHECGHAFDHAYRLSNRRSWRKVFGSPNAEYDPEFYLPRPYSKSFVRHLPNWYAQAHPDEDFAETFAVWLATPPDEWRRRYKGWKAIEKLEYVDTLVREVAKKPALVTGGRRVSNAVSLKKTLASHYAWRRRLWGEQYPDFYDADLRAIFEKGEAAGTPAARFMRQHKKAIVRALVQWTGQRKYTVDELTRKLTKRCERLRLSTPKDEASLLLDIGAFLAALVTNHLHTGRFKRSV